MKKIRLYKYLLLCIYVNCLLSDNKLFSSFEFLKFPLLFGAGLCALLLMLHNRKVENLVYQVPLILFGLINYYKTDSSWGLYSILLVLMGEDLPLKDALKDIFKLMLFVLCVNLVSFVWQYATGTVLTSLQTTGHIRYAMGFPSPNFAAQFWTSLVFLYYFLHGDEIPTKMYLILIMGTFIFYYFTDSDALVFILLIPIFAYLDKSYKFIQIRKLATRFSFLFLWVFTFLLIHTKGILYVFFNQLFTGRLYLADLAFSEYDFTWLGQKVEMFKGITMGKDWSFLVVDNAYAYLSIYFGISYLVLLSVAFVFNKNITNVRVQVCIVMYAFAALAENNILAPYMIFPALIAFNKPGNLRNSQI